MRTEPVPKSPLLRTGGGRWWPLLRAAVVVVLLVTAGLVLDREQQLPKLYRGFVFCGQLRVVMANMRRGPVPLSINRHASVHVTTKRRQFSKRNATPAIGRLVSAICNDDAAARQPAHRG